MKIANVQTAAAWDGQEGDPGPNTRTVSSDVVVGGRSKLSGWGQSRRSSTSGSRTGKPTRDFARMVAPGSVLRVDLSAKMLEGARPAARM